MTDPLDTLRPEVADAVSALDETTCMTNPGLKWYATIRAELLRLASAEAELAALKARIAGSRHAFLGPNMDRITFLADEIGPNGKYALVKVEE